MSDKDTVTLYHSPNTRSTGVLTLLEELGAPYQLHVLNMKAGEQRGAAYLAVNPMGKVPAVKHGDALITEQVAIYIYLADLFPRAGLAPAIGDPLRGPYLRWLVFYSACLEPAIIDRHMKREPGPVAMTPYGDFDSTIGAIVKQVERGPWLLGERMTAADVLWGTALTWIVGFGLMPKNPAVTAYVERWGKRPSVARVAEIDARLAAAHAAA